MTPIRAKTLELLDKLPDDKLIYVFNILQNIEAFSKSEEIQEMSLQDDAVSRVFLPMSKEDFLHDVEVAEKEIASGKYRNAERVFDGLEKRYGF